MRRKKKIVTKNYVIAFVLIFFLIVGLIINIFFTNRNLTVFEKAIKDSIYTVENVISYPIKMINNKIKENKEKEDLYNKYKVLKERLEESEYVISENIELKKQLSDMKEILELNSSLVESKCINATVISRNIEYFNSFLVIDKGESSGIKKDMPVIVKEGLIGKVISTTTFTSTVRLLIANNSNDKISVKIDSEDGYVYGVLNGYDTTTNKYIIEGVSYNDNIKIDSLVTTTGMGEVFPSGIVIGKVSNISTDVFDLANIIEVESLVDFDDINYVSVLKRSVE